MDAVEEIKQRLSIEDIVGEYVQLKRAGRNLKGLSPFTSEKTPSLIVSPEKQIWHDFSSSRGGDIFSFVMEAEGLAFKEAIDLLARKAGIDLEKYYSNGRRSGPDKERLYAANEAAARFYQVQFSHNNVVLDYVLKKRQFSKETALAWRLGYSPNTGFALVDFLKQRGFSEAEIKQAGLGTQRYGRNLGDMFRGRLMIPLMDSQGKVVGFTARLIKDEPDSPKYINTPATTLYDKSRHVFGLNFAKEDIRKSGFSVLAEGNLDVISSHQAGVKQTVATAGTALTEYQLKTLARFAPDVRLSFDNDRAGLAAAERAIPIASRVGISLSIITITGGKDPDELIKQDVGLWQEAINKSQYALDWLMDRYEKSLDITSAEGKRKFSDVILPVVETLSDAVEKDHYLNKIAEKMGVSRRALDQKLDTKTVNRPLRRVANEVKAPDLNTIENLKLQDHFLAILRFKPELLGYASIITADMLYTPLGKKTLAELKSADPNVAPQMQNLVDYDKILLLEFEELYQGLELTELQYEAARLQARLVDQYVKTEKTKLTIQLASADEEATAVLLKRVGNLNALLKQVQGGANV
jgi:DNA primase